MQQCELPVSQLCDAGSCLCSRLIWSNHRWRVLGHRKESLVAARHVTNLWSELGVIHSQVLVFVKDQSACFALTRCVALSVCVFSPAVRSPAVRSASRCPAARPAAPPRPPRPPAWPGRACPGWPWSGVPPVGPRRTAPAPTPWRWRRRDRLVHLLYILVFRVNTDIN